MDRKFFYTQYTHLAVRGISQKNFVTIIGISVQGNYYSVVATGDYKVLGTPLMIAVRARRKQIVNKLLEMGANPNVFIAVANYNRADIMSWNSSPYTYNSKITGGPWGCKRSKTFLCALLDCYMKMDLQIGRKQPNASDEDEIAKMLIEYGAGFISVTGRICSNGGHACPQPTPFDFRYSQKPDNSAEISMLQNQMQTIMQEISDCERRIMQLRYNACDIGVFLLADFVERGVIHV